MLKFPNKCAPGWLAVGLALLLPLAGCGDGGDGAKNGDAQSGEQAAGATAAQQADEAGASGKQAVEEKYVWDLTELYPDEKAWNAARKSVLDTIPRIEKLKGTLGDSAQSLENGLDLISGTYKKATRVSVYANLIASTDLRDGKALERRQLAQQMMAKLSEAVSFVTPEILEIGEQKVKRYLAQNEGLKVHRFNLMDTLRQAPHTLGKEAEAVLAATGLLTASPNNVYGVLANSDVPWPAFTLPDGEEVTLNQAGYVRLRVHPDREVRKQVFDSFWSTFSEYSNSFGSMLAAEVQANLFQSKARKYDSILDWALDEDNLPPEVYRTLVEEVNRGLPVLHRYFKLRARMLGIEDMGYHDIYPPLVELDRKFDIETSRRLTIAANSKLGNDFVRKLSQATKERWMHVYPQKGKRSGAYMSGGAYDVHPYVFLNHNDSFDSLSTYAHEWGHAMHSILTNENQPWEMADYSTFIAEVASTGQELLLFQHMVDNARTDEEKLFYLGQALETFRGTFFRQTMFAEFELAVHEEVEKGGALSGERLTELYTDLVRRYHGHDQGVVTVDDQIGYEWAYIPHFYYDFYVFQYSTSIAAASYLAQQVTAGADGAVENFLDVMRAGGSKYPYDILKDAGLDMASPEPYRALVRRMDSIMDQIEEILDRREAEGGGQ
ncbi:MAG: oligoendopeptidase F, partial [Alphaproteobacteria bacterium]